MELFQIFWASPLTTRENGMTKKRDPMQLKMILLNVLVLVMGIFLSPAGATETLTLQATQDSFLSSLAQNLNLGGDRELEVQTIGNNRTLVAFNVSGVSREGLIKATLVLTIKSKPIFWKPSGSLVLAYPLLHPWAEGMGSNLIKRSSGPGVTWNCATDQNIQNLKMDCSGEERWNGGRFGAASGPGVVHTNGLMGEVVWDVTADLVAGAELGWLLKKENERELGFVQYYSKEGAAAAGKPAWGPRLVLEYEDTVPPPVLTSVEPNTGPSGTLVRLTGSGFSANSVVTFEGIPAPIIKPPTATEVVVAVPVRIAGNIIEPLRQVVLPFVLTEASPSRLRLRRCRTTPIPPAW